MDVLLGLLGAVIGVATVLVISNDGKKRLRQISVMVMLLCTIGSMFLIELATIKDTSIKNLNGNWEYEKQYVYRFNDTIPVDTIYVKLTSPTGDK